MIRILVAAARILRAFAGLLLGLCLTVYIALADALGRRPPWVPQRVRWWYGWIARSLGLRVEVEGVPAKAALLVANHVSWLDILALGAVAEICFLSKAEVRQWPVIGWMASIAGTLFISRGANEASGLAGIMVEHIRQGQTLAVFPEGTTSDGTALRRFHPRLFAVGQHAGIRVQPVAVRYGTGPEPDPVAPFVGEDTLLAHLLRISGHRGLTAQVHFLTPIDSEKADRRQLAEESRNAIAAVLGLSTADSSPPRRTAAAASHSIAAPPAGPIAAHPSPK